MRNWYLAALGVGVAFFAASIAMVPILEEFPRVLWVLPILALAGFAIIFWEQARQAVVNTLLVCTIAFAPFYGYLIFTNHFQESNFKNHTKLLNVIFQYRQQFGGLPDSLKTVKERFPGELPKVRSLFSSREFDYKYYSSFELGGEVMIDKPYFALGFGEFYRVFDQDFEEIPLDNAHHSHHGHSH